MTGPFFPFLYTLSCFVIYKAFLSNNESSKVSTNVRSVTESSNQNRSIPFPQSIRLEDFETIVHPGNAAVDMSVPKFWVPNINLPHAGERLMTQEEALAIGSKITIPNPDFSTDKSGEKELVLETVFIMIASYRDWQCPRTLESIFTRAKYPERVRVAVVDQMDTTSGLEIPCGEPPRECDGVNADHVFCRYRSQIDTYEMEDELAVGPCFARHIGHRMYRGEYYAMQVDAHVTFVQDWDTDVINQIKVTGNEMAVLTTYLSDVQGSIDPVTNKSLRKTRPIMCNTQYESNQQGTYLRHRSQPEGPSSIKGSPQMEPYWAAGFSFARGHFIVNVPYDQYLPMIFLGEEMSIGLRGFTYGYDMYANEKSICFHSYAIGKNKDAREKVNHFWEHSELYAGVGKKAMKRVLGVVKMNPEVAESEWDHTELDKYGIGKVRTVEKFYETFGIDVVKKHAADNLCDFVEHRMHKMFQPLLRRDGMGVDYDKVKFQLKEI